MDEQNHDDGCRCLNCCRAKFKTIDPASYGKMPVTTLDEVLSRMDESGLKALQQVLQAIETAAQGS